MRKLRDQLLVSEPIEPALLEEDGDPPALQQWWSQVLDRIGAKYDLGDRADVAMRPNAPTIPMEQDELLLMVGPGLHVPEHLLDSISSALIELGADVDDWVGHPGAVGLPLAGQDVPMYLSRGAAMAEGAGFVVLHPPTAR